VITDISIDIGITLLLYIIRFGQLEQMKFGWSSEIAAAILLIFVGCLFAGSIRIPQFAGVFYPGNPAVLASTVDSMIALATVPSDVGRPAALISPHAGYIYSGPTAAYGYKLLKGLDYSTIIIIGPSHRVGFDGCAVYNEGKWRTPLGDVEIDAELADRLCNESSAIYPGTEEHRQEHSIEVQVPFLQRVLGRFKIVPIEMGYQSETTIKALADALSNVLRGRDDILLVVSTDLSHYYPRETAEQYDNYCISLIQNMKGETLASKLQTDAAKMCGGGPTAAVLIACERLGLTGVRILKYDDSGTSSGDPTSVVGYVSAVIYREDEVETKPQKSEKNETEEYLSKSEQHALLKLARQSIEAAVNNGDRPALDNLSGKLAEPGAAFVTITINGQLRGCIGYTEAIVPLKECVSECAVSAALRDPRFNPLSKQELDKIDLEISVLTPLVDVEDVNDITVGRDGLMISHMGRRGLLLPQVATDYGWDRETFLAQTCRKAGLPTDAWKTGAQIQKFTAFVFGGD